MFIPAERRWAVGNLLHAFYRDSFLRLAAQLYQILSDLSVFLSEG